jgi:hypothetical protein
MTKEGEIQGTQSFSYSLNDSETAAILNGYFLADTRNLCGRDKPLQALQL